MIKVSLSGLNQFKRDLQKYKTNVLERKVKTFISELLKIGIEAAQTSVNESPLGQYVTLSTDISADNMGCTGILIAKGEIKYEVDNNGKPYPPFSTILAIEFGAGIYHNATPNPNSVALGLGVGTFPNQTHAFNDVWFYWDEADQLWKPTHGVKATMPMYNAQMEIMQQMVKVAKTIF